MTFQDSESVRLPNYTAGGITQTRTRGTLSPQRDTFPTVDAWMSHYEKSIKPAEASKIRIYLMDLFKSGKPLPRLGVSLGPITVDYLKRSAMDGDYADAFNVPGVIDPALDIYQ